MTSVVGDPAVSRALVGVERDGEFARVTMNVPERRNALSLEHMRQLLAAVRKVGASDARGLLLAANGPVFCAGHDFADMVQADLAAMRELLALCTELMMTLQSIPQPVLARVQGWRRPPAASSSPPRISRSRLRKRGSRSPAAKAAGSATRRWSGLRARCRASARSRWPSPVM